jgi:hypothetical protein
MAKDMFKVDGAEYTFSTWFASILSKDLINILLTAKSEKEVAEKAKEIFLQKEHGNTEYGKEMIQEDIKALIQRYKAEDKGSPEWIAHLEHSFEKEEIYEAGITKERAKKILDAIIDDDRFLIRVKFVKKESSYNRRHNYAFKIIDKY